MQAQAAIDCREQAASALREAADARANALAASLEAKNVEVDS